MTTTAATPDLYGKALLMTARAEVTNLDDKTKDKEVIVFFDTGSHKSYITKAVADELGLKVAQRERLHLCIFASLETRELESSQVQIEWNIPCQKERMKLQVNVIDSIIASRLTGFKLKTTMEEHQFKPEIYTKRKPKEEKIFEISATAIVKSNESSFEIENFSKWKRAVRVMAIVLRFVKKIRRKKNGVTNTLTAEELSEARKVLIKEAQNREKPDEATKKTLELFQDENRIWRSKGRIGNSLATELTKEPIWLPKNDKTTELIVLDVHTKTFHAGTNTTLSKLRQTYWLAQGRRRIKGIVKNLCLICRKSLERPYKLPKMPDLPGKRVTECSPFKNTGLDYFGPINVRKNKDGTSKIWICIFTCFVTRAIHLKIAEDMSGEAFLLAFKRFKGRQQH